MRIHMTGRYELQAESKLLKYYEFFRFKITPL